MMNEDEIILYVGITKDGSIAAKYNEANNPTSKKGDAVLLTEVMKDLATKVPYIRQMCEDVVKSKGKGSEVLEDYKEPEEAPKTISVPKSKIVS